MAKTGVIFYFSGTGNTKWVADKVAQYLNQGGLAAKVLSIERVDSQTADRLIKENDLIGFAYPIHVSDVPENMKSFMKNLSPADDKETMVFCSQWMFFGDGARAGAAFIRNKGFRVRYAEHFFMPNNVCVTILPLPYTTDEDKIGKVLKKTEKRIKDFTTHILNNEKTLRGYHPVSTALALMQRGPYRLGFSHMRDDVAIDKDHCIDCGQCVKLCPTGNLYYHDGAIASKGNCITCCRCYNFCPASAVLYIKKPHKKSRGAPYRGPYQCLDPGDLRK